MSDVYKLIILSTILMAHDNSSFGVYTTVNK